MHQQNCFITLTYNDENIPLDGSLIKSDFKNFIRRLRKYAKCKIRYYHAGEYGEQNKRPHYHAILFGYNFPDWEHILNTPDGEPIYTSNILEKIWKKGFVNIGECTFESAGYVARYCMKKLNGPLKHQINEKTGLKPYERFHSFTGEISEVLPEYSTMSRRPGIGKPWFSRYTRDVFPKDYLHVKGVRMPPPKIYYQYLKEIDPDMYDYIKADRTLKAYESDENTRSRLSARETVKKAQFKQLKRSL